MARAPPTAVPSPAATATVGGSDADSFALSPASCAWPLHDGGGDRVTPGAQPPFSVIDGALLASAASVSAQPTAARGIVTGMSSPPTTPPTGISASLSPEPSPMPTSTGRWASVSPTPPPTPAVGNKMPWTGGAPAAAQMADGKGVPQSTAAASGDVSRESGQGGHAGDHAGLPGLAAGLAAVAAAAVDNDAQGHHGSDSDGKAIDRHVKDDANGSGGDGDGSDSNGGWESYTDDDADDGASVWGADANAPPGRAPRSDQFMRIELPANFTADAGRTPGVIHSRRRRRRRRGAAGGGEAGGGVAAVVGLARALSKSRISSPGGEGQDTAAREGGGVAGFVRTISKSRIPNPSGEGASAMTAGTEGGIMGLVRTASKSRIPAPARGTAASGGEGAAGEPHLRFRGGGAAGAGVAVGGLARAVSKRRIARSGGVGGGGDNADSGGSGTTDGGRGAAWSRASTPDRGGRGTAAAVTTASRSGAPPPPAGRAMMKRTTSFSHHPSSGGSDSDGADAPGLAARRSMSAVRRRKTTTPATTEDSSSEKQAVSGTAAEVAATASRGGISSALRRLTSFRGGGGSGASGSGGKGAPNSPPPPGTTGENSLLRLPSGSPAIARLLSLRRDTGGEANAGTATAMAAMTATAASVAETDAAGAAVGGSPTRPRRWAALPRLLRLPSTAVSPPPRLLRTTSDPVWSPRGGGVANGGGYGGGGGGGGPFGGIGWSPNASGDDANARTGSGGGDLAAGAPAGVVWVDVPPGRVAHLQPPPTAAAGSGGGGATPPPPITLAMPMISVPPHPAASSGTARLPGWSVSPFLLVHNALRVELADLFHLVHAQLRLGNRLAPRHATALRGWWGHFHPALTGLTAAAAEVVHPWAAAAAASADDPLEVAAALASLESAAASATVAAIAQCWAFDRGAYKTPSAALVGLWGTATTLVRELLPAFADAEAVLPPAVAAHFRKADAVRVEKALLVAIAFPRGRRSVSKQPEGGPGKSAAASVPANATDGPVSVEGGDAVVMVIRGAGTPRAGRAILRNGGLSASQRAAHPRWVEALERGHWGIVREARKEAEGGVQGGGRNGGGKRDESVMGGYQTREKRQ
ncbi:hypothetical protein MMPV_001558 [Pyropia vietnamensis]